MSEKIVMRVPYSQVALVINSDDAFKGPANVNTLAV